MNRRDFLFKGGASIAIGGTAAWYSDTRTESRLNAVDGWRRKLVDARTATSQQRPVRSQDAIYFDLEHGLIVHEDGNGGDTAQREGMYWLAKWFYANRLLALNGKPPARLPEFQPWRAAKVEVPRILGLLQREPGVFVRHPSDPQYNRPEQMSRDNLVPLIAMMGVFGQRQALSNMYDRMERKLGIFGTLNKDNLDFFRQMIRRARDQAVQETLDHFILDGAVDAGICCALDGDKVGKDLNLMIQLLLPEALQGKNYVAAIRKRYVDDRPANYGIYLTAYYGHHRPELGLAKHEQIRRIEAGINAGWNPDCTNAFGALKWYFRYESGGNWGMPNLFKPIYDTYFAGPIPPPGTRYVRAAVTNPGRYGGICGTIEGHCDET
jgi:hypothetical protein